MRAVIFALVSVVAGYLITIEQVSGANIKLSSKEIQADGTQAYLAWFDQTFIKCGDQRFMGATGIYSHVYVYEIVGHKHAIVDSPRREYDKANDTTYFSVDFELSADRSRFDARPDDWSPGLNHLQTGGWPLKVAATRVNSLPWEVVAKWARDFHPVHIECKDVPKSMLRAGLSFERPASPNSTLEGTPTPEPAAKPGTTQPTPAAGEWYMLAGLSCEPGNPVDLIAMSKLLGVSVVPRDVKEGGKVIATTISADDGSVARYFRGRARCEAAIRHDVSDLDRYK